MEYRVLNVGGGNESIDLPEQYADWKSVLLDIDPAGKPDIVCDARELTTLDADQFDAIYCSHNLEHYYRHDVPRVLAGFQHVLKGDGFAHIRVPDMAQLMQTVVEQKLDIDDFLYQSPAGPITVRDVVYGYGLEIERSGNDYYAHKTGFTAKSLSRVLQQNGFPLVVVGTGNLEVVALAFKTRPSAYVTKLFNLPDSVLNPR